jgi:hypothetical protein
MTTQCGHPNAREYVLGQVDEERMRARYTHPGSYQGDGE